MNQLTIIRRYLTILRQVKPPYLYPNKAKILERLREEDLESVSNRTFERDIQEIESYYGLRIEYCRRHRGYFLNQPEDEDLSNFRQFFELLERSERLAFLTHSSDALRASKYLLLEENQSPLGLQHLPILWESLLMQRQLAFHYQSFKTTLSKSYQIDPLLLLEYRNRWYLAAWDASDQLFKTFGLERIQEPQLTQVPVQEDRRPQFLVLKQNALGVYISLKDEVREVVLQVSTEMAPYIKTVPIHASQTVNKENEKGMVISLHIIINPELENAILSYGEHIKVLEPVALREKIKQRAQDMANQYNL